MNRNCTEHILEEGDAEKTKETPEQNFEEHRMTQDYIGVPVCSRLNKSMFFNLMMLIV